MTAVNAMLVIIVLSLLAYALLGGADFGGGFWDLVAGISALRTWPGPRRRAGRRVAAGEPTAARTAAAEFEQRAMSGIGRRTANDPEKQSSPEKQSGPGRRHDPEGQRELIAASLGPVWEANHVWLIFVIVSVFSAFPAAFGTIATSLELPLGLALVGIVLRGAAYVYRAYGGGAALPDQWWGRIFAGASVLTPFMFGVSGAALATGGLGPHSAPTEPFRSAFALTAGVLAIVVTAFLAAVYLCHDAAQHPATTHLVPVFRRRAMGAAVVAGVVVLAMLPLFYRDAPVVAARFTDRSLPIAAVSALCGVGSLLVLWRERYVLARVIAATAVAGVLGGWAAAQYPDLLVGPSLLAGTVTVSQAAAAPQSVDAMLVAMAFGMAVVLPSFYLLLKVFSSPAADEH